MNIPQSTSVLGYLLCWFFISATMSHLSAEDNKPAVPLFIDGQAQVVPAFKKSKEWIRHFLWVETTIDSDGDGRLDRMHVDVQRPKQTESEGLKVPTIHVSTPYAKSSEKVPRSGSPYLWDPKQELGVESPEHEILNYKALPANPTMVFARFGGADSGETWIPRGFAVVRSSSLGTGYSEGCPSAGAESEALGLKAVIDWLCGRARGYTTPNGQETVSAFWSTGKVGMTGYSHEGTLALTTATTGVVGLEAVLVQSSTTSLYHYYRSNGLVRHPGGYIGEDIDVLFDIFNSGSLAQRAFGVRTMRQDILKNFDRRNGDYNDFWSQRDLYNRLDHVRAAVFLAHGLNDWNVMPEMSARIYQGLREKGKTCMIYLSQDGHGVDPPFSLVNRYFSHYLYGIDNGVESGPRSWIVRENDKKGTPTAYADYPHPDAQPVTWYLSEGGNTSGGLMTAMAAQAGAKDTETFTDNVKISAGDLAMAEHSPHRLLYVTPVLTAPVHISGLATVTVRLACNKPAANFSVYLASIPWTKDRAKMTDNMITCGWADPQNHASLTKGEPLIPGKFYNLTFTLQPDDQVITAGKRIGLMLFSSDKYFTLHPEPGTELCIDLDGSSLILPIVGGMKAVSAAISANVQKH